MKKKALVLAGCMAFTAPSISIAQALPGNLVGLNLGEIQASSHLNQPFRGVIPFLFTSVKASKQLNVRLASESVFAQIGAEKLPILDDLKFQVTLKANKPVILISSNKPVELPFLNFVLEIEGPDGVVYQDYTVLLDPPNYQKNTLETRISSNQQAPKTTKKNSKLLLKTYSSPSMAAREPFKYKVKSGDSLSVIAQKQARNDISLKQLMQAIYEQNPKAFIRGDINKLKRGVVLNLPRFEDSPAKQSIAEKSSAKEISPVAEVKASFKEVKPLAENTYKVSKGDNLSKITKQFVPKDVSFTKMMSAIFTANPDAFSKNRKSLLKAGATLKIPTIEEINGEQPQIAETANESKPKTVEKVPLADLSLMISSNTVGGKTVELKEGEYRIKEGDTLTKITKNIGYKNATFTKMMKAIYIENPDAFEKNNITKLKVGAVIQLPVINDVEQTAKIKPEQLEVATTVPVNNEPEIVKPTELKTTPTRIPSSTSNNASDALEKRIRELRAELDQAKTGLSSLKTKLDKKDLQLNKKDSELVNLKSALIKLKINQTSNVNEAKPLAKIDENDLYGTTSSAKAAELAVLALSEKEAVNSNEGFNNKLKNYVSSYLDVSSAKDMTYMSIALILGLILIRYRREIYSYTKINFDHPNYYPAPNPERYELKEKNITFHDPVEEVEPESTEHFETVLEKHSEPENHTEPEFISYPESELVNNDDTDDVSEEESEEIEHCEHLVTELFDDLSTNPNLQPTPENMNSQWESIEQVCDNYIEKIKEDDEAPLLQEDDAEPNNAVADFETMMSDLLQSLDEADAIAKNDETEESSDIFSDYMENHAFNEQKNDRIANKFPEYTQGEALNDPMNTEISDKFPEYMESDVLTDSKDDEAIV